MSKVVDYFLKYVAFDTQSAEDAGTVPSTEKQFALAKLLSEQLKNIGVKDVSMSEHGYVYGTIPANGDYNCQTVGFLAHMDTSPDCPDENVRPQLVKHYDGKDITLNKALGVKMTTKMFPFLKNYVGQDLITTDGTTLLGADDKAGIAEIMTMAETLLTHPEIRTEPSRSLSHRTRKSDTVLTSLMFPAGAQMWLILLTAAPGARWSMRPSTRHP